MSEITEETRIAYWNTLFSAPINAQLAYIEQLHELADVVILTECNTETARQLKNEYEHVDTDERMFYKGQSFGMTVLSKYPVQVDRKSPWQAITYETNQPSTYRDHRDYVRFVLEHKTVGSMAVFGAHISHPNHVWRPRINMRRREEWRQHALALATETLPFVWLADTNTVLAQTVTQRLGLATINGVMLPHDGRATWGPSTNGYRKLLYLDRAAVSQELAGRSRLETLQGVIGGTACPSDHRALLAVVE